MAGYFPIFKSVKTNKPAAQEIKPPPKPIKEEDTSTKLHCMICYKYTDELDFSYDLNDKDFEQSSNIFENYVSLLRVQLIPSMQWNFRTEKLPFCRNCLMKVKNLSVLQNKLVFALKQIKKSVMDMKIEILKSQNNVEKRTLSTEGAELVEVELVSVLNSKYQEKVDYFRRLVVKEFIPDVVLSRKEIFKKNGQTFHAKRTSDVSLDNKLDAKNPNENMASSLNPSMVKHDIYEFVASGISDTTEERIQKTTIAEGSSTDGGTVTIGESNLTDKYLDARKFSDDHDTKELCSSSVKNRMILREKDTILQEVVIVHDIVKSTIAEARINFKKIGNSHWLCKLCNRRFIVRHGGRRIPNFRRHLDDVHRNITPYQCRLCSQRFYEKNKCCKHIMSVHVDDLDTMFVSSSNNLQQGIGIASDDLDMVERNICATKSEKIKNKKLKNSHGSGNINTMQTQAPAEKNAVYWQFYTKSNNHFKCKFCASNIMFRTNLKRHFINYHGPLEKFQCQHCQRIFSSERMHEMHLKTDHDIITDENNEAENQRTTPYIMSSTKSRADTEVPLQATSINRAQIKHPQSENKDNIDKTASRFSLDDTVDSDKPKISILPPSSSIFEIQSPERPNSVNDAQRKERNVSCNSNELETEGNEDQVIANTKSNGLKSTDGKGDSRVNDYPPHIERGIINASGNRLTTNINEYFEGIPGDGNKVRCKVCSVVITKPKSHRHYFTVHNKLVFRYKCKYCSKRFYYKSECALHIRVNHYMEKPYQCSHCPASFTTVSSRAIHCRKCSFLSSTSK